MRWFMKGPYFCRLKPFCYVKGKGPGAGYIGGHTWYFAFRPQSLRWELNFRNGFRSDGKRHSWLVRRFGLMLGVTRNANLVPYHHWPD